MEMPRKPGRLSSCCCFLFKGFLEGPGSLCKHRVLITPQEVAVLFWFSWLPWFYMCIDASIHPSMHPSIHPSLRRVVLGRQSTPLHIHPSIQPSVHLSMNAPIAKSGISWHRKHGAIVKNKVIKKQCAQSGRRRRVTKKQQRQQLL